MGSHWVVCPGCGRHPWPGGCWLKKTHHKDVTLASPSTCTWNQPTCGILFGHISNKCYWKLVSQTFSCMFLTRKMIRCMLKYDRTHNLVLFYVILNRGRHKCWKGYCLHIFTNSFHPSQTSISKICSVCFLGLHIFCSLCFLRLQIFCSVHFFETTNLL